MLNRHELKTLKFGFRLLDIKTESTMVVKILEIRVKFKSLIRFLQYRRGDSKATVVNDGNLCVF